MNTSFHIDPWGTASRGQKLPGRVEPLPAPPPYVPPVGPSYEVFDPPAPVVQPIYYVRQRPWRPLLGAVLAVVAGNLLVHLYCQDWHLASPSRPPSGATIFSAVIAVFFLVVSWREYWSKRGDVLGVVLPSVIGGVSALVAWLAGMAGPASWIPAYGNLLPFFSEGELFFVPLTTLVQVWLLTRLCLTPDPIPF